MNKMMLLGLAPVGAALAFNAFNGSKVGMEKISGKWACTLTMPNGQTGKLVETFNYSGDSWGSITNTGQVGGSSLKVVLRFSSNWSASETSIRHKYKDLAIVTATLNGADLGQEAREDALKGMQGEERVSQITLLTDTQLNYEHAEGKVACKREPTKPRGNAMPAIQSSITSRPVTSLQDRATVSP